MTKLKFKSNILNFIFIIFLSIFFTIFFHTYVQKSGKYCEENKERLQKKLVRDTKIFLKRKKKKNSNMVVNVRKIFQKMKNKSLLSIEKVV